MAWALTRHTWERPHPGSSAYPDANKALPGMRHVSSNLGALLLAELMPLGRQLG